MAENFLMLADFVRKNFYKLVEIYFEISFLGRPKYKGFTVIKFNI